MSDVTLYSILYIEINIFSVILVVIVQLKTLGLSKMVAQRHFSMSMVSLIMFILSDMMWVVTRNNFLPYSPALILLYKDIYFFSASLMCYFWFVYFEYLQDSPFVANRRRVWVSSIFVWVQLALIITNHFTPMLYYLDEDDRYHRGLLFVSLYVFSYVYVMFTCSRALVGFFDPSKKDQRRKLIKLALFPVFPAIGGLFQYVIPSIPVLCITLAIAVLSLYLDWAEELISVDPLTKLNNRKQLLFLYDQWTKSSDDHEPLFVLMVDADKFKSINDTYGHIEGDIALKRIAEAMKLGTFRWKDKVNLSRYGGDEFVIMAKGITDEDASEIRNKVTENLKELNKKAASPYDVCVSIGIAKVDSSEGLSFSDVAEIADEELYMQKKARRK